MVSHPGAVPANIEKSLRRPSTRTHEPLTHRGHGHMALLRIQHILQPPAEQVRCRATIRHARRERRQGDQGDITSSDSAAKILKYVEQEWRMRCGVGAQNTAREPDSAAGEVGKDTRCQTYCAYALVVRVYPRQLRLQLWPSGEYLNTSKSAPMAPSNEASESRRRVLRNPVWQHFPTRPPNQ